MKPEAALNIFESRLAQGGIDRAWLTLESGVQAMLAFYREERADNCRFEHDADMLLYSWGIYEQTLGNFFTVGITRQLILNGSGEDDDIWQLSLIFRFVPTAALRILPSGDRWCHDLNELEGFEAFIRDSEAFQALATAAPASVACDYECVG